jgi:hypothetical protein
VAIETTCSGCGQKLAVADENAGKRARCPACGQIYTIPHPSASQSTVDAGLAATTAGPTDEQDSSPLGSASGAEFWMRTADGTEYGPVDRQTLQRWFAEGRIGPGYQIRDREQAEWQSADLFRVAAMPTSGNPYAENPYQATAGQGMTSYPKSDQSGLVLTMGILSFLLCPLFGIVAWVMGHTALKDIQAGRADPRNKGLVQVGYYLGIASVVINLLCFGGYFVLVAIAMIGGGMQ